jgi:quinol monooxygenase YgiN
MIQLTLCLVATTGRAHLLAEALLGVMRRTQQHAGCSGAHLLTDVADPSVFWYCEDWEDPLALEHRVRSEPFAQLLALMETSARPPTLEFRTVDAVRGLEYVEAVRQVGSGLE